jgi:hypothetical protein
MRVHHRLQRLEHRSSRWLHVSFDMRGTSAGLENNITINVDPIWEPIPNLSV